MILARFFHAPARFGSILLAGMALALLSGCGGSAGVRPAAPAGQLAATSQGVEDASGYRLGSGDQVRVIVFGQPDMTGEYQVDGSGRISFPLVGLIEAGGLTAAELEQRLRDSLDPDYLVNPSVSVEVLTYRPFYIVGEVQNPGSYPFVNGMTVINAVAMAGGFTYRAREDDFYIERAGSGARQLASPGTKVLPGDVITVRERWF